MMLSIDGNKCLTKSGKNVNQKLKTFQASYSLCLLDIAVVLRVRLGKTDILGMNVLVKHFLKLRHQLSFVSLMNSLEIHLHCRQRNVKENLTQ